MFPGERKIENHFVYLQIKRSNRERSEHSVFCMAFGTCTLCEPHDKPLNTAYQLDELLRMSMSGQYFVGKEPFRIGVSYWPRGSALDLWKRFDVDEVHEDFSILSELGVNLARVALLWEDFQPEPDSLRCSALAHLLELCDAAASEGVRLELLLCAGQVDDPSRFPRWLRETDATEGAAGSCGLVNPFSHPIAKQAATTLVRGIARSVGTHPAIWAYNLGDRPDRLAPHCCRVAANAWFNELRQVIHSIDPKHPVTCSLGSPNLTTNDALRVDQVFSVLDHSTIDSGGLAGDLGPGDSESQALFSCALTTALTGKPCLLQEGLRWPGAASSDSVSAKFDRQATSAKSLLNGLHRAGALGVVIGAFSDQPNLQSSSLANGGLGLLDVDGEPRAHAEAIQEFAHAKPLVQRNLQAPVTLGMTADEFYKEPGENVRRLYGEFHAFRNSGVPH